MKRYKICLFTAAIAIIAFAGCKNEDPDRNPFDNKVFITSGKTDLQLIKKDIRESERPIRAEIAKPAPGDITLTFAAEPSLLETYNMAYYDDAILLDSKYYELTQPHATIAAGKVKSTDATVHFRNIDELSRDYVYVLPVTMQSATDIDILGSAKNTYFVFRAGALINVVGDIEKTYAEVKTWNKPEAMKNLTKITMETLVRIRAYTQSETSNNILSLMGIEGYYLLRFGDSNAQGQLQVANAVSNFPAKDETKVIPLNKWVHIALTHDLASGDYVIYMDGKKQSWGTVVVGSLDLTRKCTAAWSDLAGFSIGHSWDNKRWFPGEISEVRVWNIIRTQEEIAENPYMVATDSPGLVAYWKFDDGAGQKITDHASGNHAVAPDNLPVRWNPVTLPAPKK